MLIILFCVLVTPLPALIKSKTCTRIDDCRCRLDSDGSVVDLWPLGHQDYTPLFEDALARDGFRYSYNPCYPFNEGRCLDSGLCKVSNVSSENVASYRIDYFDWDGDSVLATYISSDNFTILVVALECDPSQVVPKFQAYGKQSASNTTPGLYNFKLRSQCACGNGCSGS